MSRPFNPQSYRGTVFVRLIEARARFGGDREIVEDHQRQPLTYTGLVRAAFALGRKIAGMTEREEHVGILLPSSVGAVAAFFAIHAVGRTPVMLNFTSGLRNLRAACAAGRVKRILTSRRFVAQGRLEELTEALGETLEIVWLEDVRKSIGTADRVFALIASAFPKLFSAKASPDDIGVILFTSGSFGAPKPVVLTHANLLANGEQVYAHIDLDPDWVFFNPLPVFHSFGLIAGIMLPILHGMKVVEYPSPLHTKTIPPLVKETGAAVLLATDTFINQYARASEGDDLARLKFVVCGAERVRPETHDLLRERFGVMLVEGYGVTETSPVISVNQPEDNHPGTAGRLLPGVEARLEPVEGITRGGRLFVRGPNVMAGYLSPAGELEPPPGGWHDTGDIVEIDGEGLVRILGRAKRFAKIGGEMVSLAAVEEMVCGLWPNERHAVVSVADPRKGEKLVLVSDHKGLNLADLQAHARAAGAPEIAVPRSVVRVLELPVLGTGKTDYVALQRIAEAEERGEPVARAWGRR
ncbi:MAG TPA: AMP-binding protein [Caulobacteraceae bacterium]|jgi:acyl-[acyl-carrier-protein]-phospholipid O-acyltransferase/long-chain-fatty-acid--[acyl-carrier-protein] ligase